MINFFQKLQKFIGDFAKYLLMFFCLGIGCIYAQQSIVIAPFNQNHNQKATNISKYIPDKIQNRLVDDDAITVLERKKLEVILEEKKLSETGLVDNKTAVEAGKLIGADFVLLGSLDMVNKKRFNVTNRIVDIEKGKVIKQWTATDIPEKEINQYINTVADEIIQMARQTIALENIVSLTNPRQNFKVYLQSNADSLTFGEMLELTITPEESAYLYVFDVGTSGDIHLLFPNRMQLDNYVEKKDTIVIGNLRTGPPAGVEIIKVIASRDSISMQEMMDIAGSKATFHAYNDKAEAFSRDLELIVSPLAEDRWASATIRLYIVE